MAESMFSNMPQLWTINNKLYWIYAICHSRLQHLRNSLMGDKTGSVVIILRLQLRMFKGNHSVLTVQHKFINQNPTSVWHWLCFWNWWNFSSWHFFQEHYNELCLLLSLPRALNSHVHVFIFNYGDSLSNITSGILISEKSIVHVLIYIIHIIKHHVTSDFSPEYKRSWNLNILKWFGTARECNKKCN